MIFIGARACSRCRYFIRRQCLSAVANIDDAHAQSESSRRRGATRALLAISSHAAPDYQVSLSHDVKRSVAPRGRSALAQRPSRLHARRAVDTIIGAHDMGLSFSPTRRADGRRHLMLRFLRCCHSSARDIFRFADYHDMPLRTRCRRDFMIISAIISKRPPERQPCSISITASADYTRRAIIAAQTRFDRRAIG